MTQLTIPNEEDMLELGRHIGEHCPLGARIYLKGDLGAGKTTFTRGFMRGRGYQGVVKSPTYTLVEPYELPNGRVYHFDLYRLADFEELEYLGLSDYLAADAICLIEWPERAGNYLPQASLYCTIDVCHHPSGRQVTLATFDEMGEALVEGLNLKTE